MLTNEEELVSVISAEYQGGKSLRAIAEEYSFSHTTIRKILNENNIPIRKRGQVEGKLQDKRPEYDFPELTLYPRGDQNELSKN
jgi:hypothetical protein